MPRIIHWYIFKETAVPFVLGMAVFTFVLLMGRLLKLAEMVFAKGVPLFDVLRLVFYMLPSFFLVAIPMAFLLAILLAFGRLSADSEITAMKASGLGIGSLMPPVLAFAALAYLATTFVTVYALPKGNLSFKKFLYDVIETRAATSIKEKVFNDDFPGLVVYVDDYDLTTHKISGILIQDERDPDDPSTIFASSGMLVSSPEDKTVRLHLENGSIHRGVESGGYRLIEFRNYDLNVILQQRDLKEKLNEQDMTIGELMEHHRNPQGEAKFNRDVTIELHRRFSMPFACFVFAIIGVPLGIQNLRSGRAGGFSAGIVLLLLYYMLMSAGKTFAEKELVPVAVAVWMPNVFFVAFGALLLNKAAQERDLPLVGAIRITIARIKASLSRLRGTP
ncbi:MAG: LPS export ABC transporter permease LptF [Desulfuromonadales bacterium]|nr:MAG: LPS export ABC transporter permease LptF [Desulfuromonadales bacterium]